MLTQAAGWAIVPDYLAVFKPDSYRWLVPALNDPIEASQLSMTLGAVLFVAIAVCELLPGIRRRAGLVGTHWDLFLCGDDLLPLRERSCLCRHGEHAAVRVLRVCFDRTGVVKFSASISHAASMGAGIRDGGSSAGQRCGAVPTGMVRLEFYPG